MRTLIFGTSYVGDDGAQRYKARMVELWAKLAVHLNPEADILLVDSASKVDLGKLLEPLGFRNYYDVQTGHFLRTPRAVFSFPDNIGHLNVNGRDGWGRAFCKGIQIAIAGCYDFACHLDADMIFTLPTQPVFEKMERSGVQVCEAWDTTYAFGETSILFFRPQYMERIKFIERYDWPSRVAPFMDPSMCPERICDEIWKDDLFTLPFRGLRDDFNRVTVNNIATAFPYGLDFLTHVKDFAVYERFLELKGIVLE